MAIIDEALLHASPAPQCPDWFRSVHSLEPDAVQRAKQTNPSIPVFSEAYLCRVDEDGIRRGVQVERTQADQGGRYTVTMTEHDLMADNRIDPAVKSEVCKDEDLTYDEAEKLVKAQLKDPCAFFIESVL